MTGLWKTSVLVSLSYKKEAIIISKCQLKMVREGMGRIGRFLAMALTLTVTAM